MPFRTKLDYSDNRQIKQRVRTNTTLSGATVFGVSFSALTTGADLSNQTTTETVSSVLSTFSGNSATTVFTWYDSRMELGATEISAITPSNRREIFWRALPSALSMSMPACIRVRL